MWRNKKVQVEKEKKNLFFSLPLSFTLPFLSEAQSPPLPAAPSSLETECVPPSLSGALPSRCRRARVARPPRPPRPAASSPSR